MMGWWSATIMGGDSPLDAQHDVLELAKVPDGEDFCWEDRPEQVRQALEAVSLAQWQAFFDPKDDYYADIQRQVVAVIHMAVGAALPQELAQQAIEASERMSVEGWRDPQARQYYLDDFIKTIRAYDGTPTQLPEEGLFDRLVELADTSPRRTLH